MKTILFTAGLLGLLAGTALPQPKLTAIFPDAGTNHRQSPLRTAGDSKNTKVVRRLDSLLKVKSKQEDFTGTVLVARKGKVIYQQAFGLANREWNIANTPATVFRIGSVTKPFTSVLVFQAVERGLLSLDGKVSDYLPDYPTQTGSKITVAQLLAHTSGLIDFTQVEGLEWNKERLRHSPEELLAYFKDRPLAFTPGSDFHYSNFGYVLLTVILEKVTGKPYQTLLEEQIFQKAGMRHSSIAENKMVIDGRASGYYTREDHYYNAPAFDPSVVKGCGDMLSTLEDLFLFDQALYSNKLLAAATTKQMFTPTLPEKNNYAYGWFVSLPAAPGGPSWVRHSGSVNGFSALLARYLEDQTTIIILANRHGVQTIPLSEAIRTILANPL